MCSDDVIYLTFSSLSMINDKLWREMIKLAKCKQTQVSYDRRVCGNSKNRLPACSF